MNEQPESVAIPPANYPARTSRSVWIPLALIGTALTAILLAFGILREHTRAAPEQNLAEEAREDLERRNFRPLSGPLEALLSDPAYQPIPTQVHPLLGQPAPDFTLLDTADKPWSLAEKLRAGPVVLIFYYGYYCNHCVSQLFGVHKDGDKFREVGATVVAVSADPAQLTRARFQKYGAFAFPVLSDPGNSVAAKYGTYTPSTKAGEEGDLVHGTFVIDRRGRVIWANRGDGPFTENRTLLVEVRRSEQPAQR